MTASSNVHVVNSRKKSENEIREVSGDDDEIKVEDWTKIRFHPESKRRENLWY